MANKYTLAGEGALWIMPDGPNTDPQFLGCHELGDISEPMGDVKLIQCSTDEPNKYETIGSFQSAPGAVTTSLKTDIRSVADYMELVKCPTGLFANVVTCGKKSVFGNWDRSFFLRNMWVTKRGISKITSMTPDSQDRAEQNFDLSAEELVRLYKISVTRQAIAETEDITAIGNCDSDMCEGDCGSSQVAGASIHLGSGVLAGSPLNPANVWHTTDKGNTLLEYSGNPFGAAEVVSAIGCIQLDPTTTRIIAARGTTDAGHAAEIAYSDDGGATWTQVNVGAVLGQFVIGPRGMFIQDSMHIWIVTQGGYIYFSDDQGATWTAQSSGGVTVQNLYAVMFVGDYGYAVGLTNTVLKSTDGGGTWTLVTGPAGEAAITINGVWVISKNTAWLSMNDGKLFYTNDGGTTWAERSFSGSGSGVAYNMSWINEWDGIMIHDAATGVGSIFYTITGGRFWTKLSTPVNLGLRDCLMVSPMLMYAVGKAQGGTGVVLRGTAA